MALLGDLHLSSEGQSKTCTPHLPVRMDLLLAKMHLESVAKCTDTSAGCAALRRVFDAGHFFSQLNHDCCAFVRLRPRNVHSAVLRGEWSSVCWSFDRHFGILDSRQLGRRVSAGGEGGKQVMEPVAQTTETLNDGRVNVDVNLESSGVVPPEVAADLVEHALVWASLHGLVMGDKELPVKDELRKVLISSVELVRRMTSKALYDGCKAGFRQNPWSGHRPRAAVLAPSSYHEDCF